MSTRHLFISGPMRSGRTTAAIAMANARHDQGIPTTFVASCPMAANLLRSSDRRPRCRIAHASPVAIVRAPVGCFVVDDAERIIEPSDFIRYAVQRQATFVFPTIVWVVRQDALDAFRKLVAETDPDGFGVDARLLAQVLDAIKTRDYSGVSHSDLELAGSSQ